MELVDYDREEVIRLEEVYVIYFLLFFSKILFFFILFFLIWGWFWRELCIYFMYVFIVSLFSFVFRDGVCIWIFFLLEVVGIIRCCFFCYVYYVFLV